MTTHDDRQKSSGDTIGVKVPAEHGHFGRTSTQLAGFEDTMEVAHQLAEGGFTEDTMVLTTTGPVRVVDLTDEHRVYALDPVTDICKPKRVVEVRRIPDESEVIELTTRRADLRVSVDHRIPYQTKSIDRTRFQRAGDLNERSQYRFINDWRTPPGRRLEFVDITDLLPPSAYEVCAWTETHGHTFRANLPEDCEPCRYGGKMGYYFDATTFKRHQDAIESIADEVTIHTGPNHHRRPYRFDGDDFVRLIGWFVTEGSIHWSASSDTGQVQIAQENSEHREKLRSLFDSLGIEVSVNARRFMVGAKVFAELFERLCGNGSKRKRLPNFVWNLDRPQKQLLLDVLVWGDGNERGSYYTSSEELAGDVLRLCLELGSNTRFSRRGDMWRIFVNSVNDGFKPGPNVSLVQFDDDLYRLTVADYSVVMAGRNGKFQWVGVSRVA